MTILVADYMENTIGKIINTLKSLIQGNMYVIKVKERKKISPSDKSFWYIFKEF